MEHTPTDRPTAKVAADTDRIKKELAALDAEIEAHLKRPAVQQNPQQQPPEGP